MQVSLLRQGRCIRCRGTDQHFENSNTFTKILHLRSDTNLSQGLKLVLIFRLVMALSRPLSKPHSSV
ncbi:hypothetical protein PanWU01x14_178440 [Parasponia andersonii]|uniref:Uncharacterized protein n=1 Tax=Parasponia andersonii TaxID=3476 RepID=A0A2P5C755_PARAD|nr:hypothetical protein PanWU01x14_178440 [Parasponia andersonii]